MRIKEIFYIVRDLKLVQIAYRFKYIFKRKYVSMRGNSIYQNYLAKTALETNKLNFDSRFVFHLKKYYTDDLATLLQNRITFLNYTIDFGNRINWHLDELNKGTRLWKLNLNYHEFLIDIANAYLETKDPIYLNYLQKTVEEWFVQNPLGTKEYGKDNWNSYAISLRLIAWIKILNLVKNELSADFYKQMIESLKVQAEFLYDNVELDILGNHLIKNWKTLIWCGHFLNVSKYISKAHKLFEKYILEQFSVDGMHEELSPMYSGLVLEDLMEVYLFEKYDGQLKSLIIKQYKKLSAITANNEYFFFNDSVNANAIQPQDLIYFYNRLFDESIEDIAREEFFNFNGYVGFRNENEHFIYDAGPVVLGSQPGHGHCDALSFEYCRNQKKIFTNTGVFEYNSGERRRYSRSTEAHNTVKIGSYDQSEVLGAFRVARRAQMSYVIKEHSAYTLLIEASVQGFNFNKHIVHYRTIKKNENQILIEDRVQSNESHSGNESFAFLHLTPEFNFRKVSDDSVLIMHQETQIALVKINYPYSIIKTEFYPEFGRCLIKDTLKIGSINSNQNCLTEINFK
jgi:uncharacterized heparinase superfamily protein